MCRIMFKMWRIRVCNEQNSIFRSDSTYFRSNSTYFRWSNSTYFRANSTYFRSDSTYSRANSTYFRKNSQLFEKNSDEIPHLMFMKNVIRKRIFRSDSTFLNQIPKHFEKYGLESKKNKINFHVFLNYILIRSDYP